jgi:hypothetical protein
MIRRTVVAHHVPPFGVGIVRALNSRAMDRADIPLATHSRDAVISNKHTVHGYLCNILSKTTPLASEKIRVYI